MYFIEIAWLMKIWYLFSENAFVVSDVTHSWCEYFKCEVTDVNKMIPIAFIAEKRFPLE